MDQADSPNSGQGQGTAPGQEPFIPKHRFDEIQAKLREAQEREALKDQLYMQQLNQLQRQQPREPEFQLTPEETGLDPQTHKAILTAAEKIATHKLAQERKHFQNIIGQMGNELEATKFIARYGSDKARYLDQIQDYQRRHAQATGGGYMDVDTAYKLVRFDEMEALEKRRSAQAQAQPGSAPQAVTPAPQAPAPTLTRSQGTPAGAAVNFEEDDLDAIEARLNEQFASGHRL
jgi:hypothetical protein